MMDAEIQRIMAIEAALPLLQEFEQGPHGGFAEYPYRCPAGKSTVGWGHVVSSGEDLDYPLTRAQADALLRQDARKALGTVMAMVTVPLTVAMQAALLCLAFNIGQYAFANSTLLRNLNAGDYAGAVDQFPRWNKATNPHTGQKVALDGLTRRRAAERTLFLRDGIPGDAAA